SAGSERPLASGLSQPRLRLRRGEGGKVLRRHVRRIVATVFFIQPRRGGGVKEGKDGSAAFLKAKGSAELSYEFGAFIPRVRQRLDGRAQVGGHRSTSATWSMSDGRQTKTSTPGQARRSSSQISCEGLSLPSSRLSSARMM